MLEPTPERSRAPRWFARPAVWAGVLISIAIVIGVVIWSMPRIAGWRYDHLKPPRGSFPILDSEYGPAWTALRARAAESVSERVRPSRDDEPRVVRTERLSVIIFPPAPANPEYFSFDAFVARPKSSPLPLITWLSMRGRTLKEQVALIQVRLLGPVLYCDEGSNRWALMLHPDGRSVASWTWSRDGSLIQGVTFQIQLVNGGTEEDVLKWLADYVASLDF